MKLIWVLTAILTLGLFLRVVDINNNPAALYGDELTIVLDANSILHTGKDQTGITLPLTFPMGAGRPAGYVYGSVPFVAVFGTSAMGVRGLSIVSGIGVILLLYLLGKRLFDQKIGLIAAGIAAISPWGIALSRGGFETNFALFLSLTGIYLFILAKRSPHIYLLSAISFGLAVHTYPTYKLTIPIVLMLLIWYQGGLRGIFVAKAKVYLIASTALLALFIVLAILQTFTGGSENRFSDINIFANNNIKQQIIQEVNQQRNLINIPEFLKPIVLNKFWNYAFLLGESYLSNFSIDYLFFHSDANPRHNPGVMGVLYLIESLLILFGFTYLFKKDKRTAIFFLVWLLIVPLATALLIEPHNLRNAFMLPVFCLLSAVGLKLLIDLPKQFKFIKVGLAMLFLFQFSIFFFRVYFLSANEFSEFWAYPARYASEYAISERANFDRIIISDRIDNIEYAFPVYSGAEPQTVIDQNNTKTSLGAYKFKKFDNVYIGSVPRGQIKGYMEGLSGRTLYIASPFEKEELEDYQIKLGKNGLPSFLVVTK